MGSITLTTACLFWFVAVPGEFNPRKNVPYVLKAVAAATASSATSKGNAVRVICWHRPRTGGVDASSPHRERGYQNKPQND